MNIPRAEETYALDCILKLLQSEGIPSPRITPEPNGIKTAPDFLLDFRTHQINLEVTISGDGFILTNDDPTKPKERESYERSSYKMLRKLENLIALWITPNESIILTFLTHVPVKNRGQLAQKISYELQQSYLSGTLHLNSPIELIISTSSTSIPQIKLQAKLTNFYAGKKEYSSLKVVLAGSLQSSLPLATASLSVQAGYILLDRIAKKKEKLSHIQGIKWLLILNTHILLDHRLYKTALVELRKRNKFMNAFEKIFLIHEASAVEL